MKQSIIFFAVIFLNISTSFAQMKKIDNTASLVKQMEQNSSSVVSIESDFKQIKFVGAFNQEIVSSGKFHYKASDKIALNYTTPISYLIVINGDKIKIESDGKKNIMNLKDNKQMQGIQSILIACMTGNFLSISNDYHTEFYEDEQNYLITVKPVSDNIKEYVAQFDIYLNKKDLSADKLRVSETEKDYTEYQFSNKKFNTISNDALFKL